MVRSDGKIRARLLLANAPMRAMRSLRSGTATAMQAEGKNMKYFSINSSMGGGIYLSTPIHYKHLKAEVLY